jgi:carboxyl-terminal processing protease
MADALNDRHTTFLVPDVWHDFSANKVAYAGYKSVTSARGSLIWIVDAGSPAALAGLRPGDTILSVNGASLAEGTTDRAPAQVIGRAVTLVVSRQGEPRQTIKLTPQSQPSAIQTRMIEGGIAYVRITGFVPPGSSQAFLDSLDREMSALDEAHPIGWVLDLRSNGGGLVRLAAQTAARFGFSGTFAEATTRGGKPEAFRSPEATKRSRPIIVLINHRTGSSAEMLTITLRDAGLVRVVGETSAGSVRLANYFEVAGGAMQITTADVRTGPNGRTLEGIGVTPDETVRLDATELAAGIDAQLLRAVSLLAGED